MNIEEAIKVLQEQFEEACEVLYQSWMAITALNAQQEREWISVDERLPEKAGFCLAAMQNSVVSMVCFETQGGHPYFWYSDSLHELKGEYAVTHWMPLPAPPKEETE